MDFPSNSKNPRPPRPDEKPEKPEQPESEEKVIEPVVVEGAVVRRKKPMGRRFTELFFSGETPRSVLGYVAQTVLVPAAKEMIRDAGEQALDRILWGRNEDRGSSRRGSRSGSSSPYISYGRASDRREDPRERPELSRRARAMHDFDEVVFPTRAEASEVITRMYDLLSRYEEVKVSDFYRLAHITPDYTDVNWGWKDLRGVETRKVRDGYIVDLPRPEHLK